ncbi:MAG: ATP-binding protein [Deltaproteobacteria bacterium]|nr:ATP-binding protein [Deltaproteobacteria bacterium]
MISDNGLMWTLNQLPDAMLVIRRDGAIVHCNHAACASLGLSRDELLTRTFGQLFRQQSENSLSLASLLERAKRSAPLPLRVSFARGLEGQVGLDFAITLSEADDHNLWIALRPVHATPVDTHEMDPGTLTEEGLYRLAFERAPVGIFQYDQRGVITACNDAMVAILGSTRHAVIGLDMTTLPNARLVEALSAALSGTRSLYEGDYVSVTGNRRSIVRVDLGPIDGERGGCAIVEEVTERRKLEAKLAQADRLATVGTLAAGVAHEINNPLAYLLSNLEYAQRRLDDVKATLGPDDLIARLLEALEHAKDGAHRVQTIVRDLKTFSRGGEEVREPVAVERSVEAAVTMAQPMIRGRAKIVREYSTVPAVLADEGRLAQVFLNLLLNAAHALSDVPSDRNQITLRIFELDDGRVCVEVSDEGEGIAPENVARVFEPFFTTRQTGVGMGLGLSVCHGLVTSLDGEISVESKLGEGSTFRVCFPRCEDTLEPKIAQLSAPRRTLSRPRRKRILVVDDEQLLARSIELQFIDTHDVELAHTGRSAIERLSREPRIDVVLCDMMLPDISGIDVFEKVRSNDPQNQQPFVFMTGGSFTPRVFKFLQREGIPCLEKPFSADQLHELVNLPHG